MKVLGIIPSRYASSRFPGKPLIDINGKSMIQRVYEGSIKSKLIDQVIVATDDHRIFNHVQSFKGKVMMTSENHQNGTERCGEVIEEFSDYDVIINIQGDEPLIKAEQLDALIDSFNNPEVQIATLIKKLNDQKEIQNPNRIKVALDKKHNALYFSRSVIPYGVSIQHYKHIGIYAWRKSILKELLKLETTEIEKSESLEQLRWLFNGYQIKCIETTIETPNVDTPKDLEKVIHLIETQNL
ncbi:3-deoxy-manno-octulosonate cytidylyltransferase [Paracrocinitomix mangrovi]|uniref:3-deoxy-manno-octulosonate cytidylyltransferase n=1 Tax=Paracrocinitomix mangrovi TaxID=2862509 RepID=UPI001C8E16E8|nr:3-deoxy-manno-octulosonate cytidylyltransferase [Paracrocinitomix mangrovi]UKN00095.1 3-deoxy-manno-octulosonate cytidylyltransferase [Paracrocinitomix mangrovi]